MRGPPRPQKRDFPSLNRGAAYGDSAEIERIALTQQPQMLIAQAQPRIAEAGTELARSPLLPQGTGVAQSTRETGN